ncbi:hypothetical protein MPER_02567 [Moniliophthora perniciosa FA553]|nr:hypothetical protein MPER_02567 [Moniliophthora perniciosa FA553]
MESGISALIHGESLTTVQAGHANIGKGMGGRDSGRVMFVAREEALYMVGIDGRGNCFAHEGLKASVQVHAAYLVIVSPPAVPSASAASATIRNIARAGDIERSLSSIPPTF